MVKEKYFAKSFGINYHYNWWIIITIQLFTLLCMQSLIVLYNKPRRVILIERIEVGSELILLVNLIWL